MQIAILRPFEDLTAIYAEGVLQFEKKGYMSTEDVIAQFPAGTSFVECSCVQRRNDHVFCGSTVVWAPSLPRSYDDNALSPLGLNGHCPTLWPFGGPWSPPVPEAREGYCWHVLPLESGNGHGIGAGDIHLNRRDGWYKHSGADGAPMEPVCYAFGAGWALTELKIGEQVTLPELSEALA